MLKNGTSYSNSKSNSPEEGVKFFTGGTCWKDIIFYCQFFFVFSEMGTHLSLLWYIERIRNIKFSMHNQMTMVDMDAINNS